MEHLLDEIQKLESENERLRSMNQAKLDMIHDLMEDLEYFKYVVKDILKNNIKTYEDSYEDYAWYCSGLAEDMYHDIFGVWSWEDNDGNESNSTQIH